MTSEYAVINGHDNYEVSRDGKVRSTTTKKYKKIYQDQKGQHWVMLVDAKSGYTNTTYVADLIEKYFGEDAREDYLRNSGEPELPSYESLLKKYRNSAKDMGFLETTTSAADSKVIKPASQGKRRSKLICNETGEEFASYKEAAEYFGVSYDKFYNSIYYYGKFNDLTFSKS